MEAELKDLKILNLSTLKKKAKIYLGGNINYVAKKLFNKEISMVWPDVIHQGNGKMTPRLLGDYLGCCYNHSLRMSESEE